MPTSLREEEHKNSKKRLISKHARWENDLRAGAECRRARRMRVRYEDARAAVPVPNAVAVSPGPLPARRAENLPLLINQDVSPSKWTTLRPGFLGALWLKVDRLDTLWRCEVRPVRRLPLRVYTHSVVFLCRRVG